MLKSILYIFHLIIPYHDIHIILYYEILHSGYLIIFRSILFMFDYIISYYEIHITSTMLYSGGISGPRRLWLSTQRLSPRTPPYSPVSKVNIVHIHQMISYYVMFNLSYSSYIISRCILL